MVENRWNEIEAGKHVGALAQRVYSSRLLGADPALVLHGGGNTSVKDEITNLFGEREAVLYVKGSGWDLATIEAPGFPAVRMESVRRLRSLTELSDPQMMNYLRTSLVDSKSPDPSVEALLHAFLPHRFIDHTHADAILTLTNQPNGEEKLRELFGDRVAYVPYVMPGFQLAKVCAEIYEKKPRVEGMILLHHGIFSFGETARESYDRMIQLVQTAEEYILSETGGRTSAFGLKDENLKARWMQALRVEYWRRGFSAVLQLDDSQDALFFVNHPHSPKTSQLGPITPDHVIRTKRVPLFIPHDEREPSKLGQLFDEYERNYRDYFERHSRGRDLQMLDPLPRVCLIPGVGIVTAGATRKDASIAMDVYAHTARVIFDAGQMEGYEALPERDLFDMEYWVLEQAKLKLGPKRLPLTGKVAAITGGAGGIGLGIAKELAEAGAVVHVLDIDDKKLGAVDKKFVAHHVDVSRREEVAKGLRKIILASGGIDILIVNAGIFGPSAPIEEIAEEEWQRGVSVNIDGAFHVVAEGLRWIKAQKSGGDIVFIASRNVPAPGPKAASYSVTKAAQTQLARVCALEGAAHGIRVNCLHPHNVVDTELRSEALLAERAKVYGMTKEQYMKNNLLNVEVTSREVGKAVFALVAGYFPCTTGAQIPVDGGSNRTL